jgi:hypothetical protein
MGAKAGCLVAEGFAIRSRMVDKMADGDDFGIRWQMSRSARLVLTVMEFRFRFEFARRAFAANGFLRPSC